MARIKKFFLIVLTQTMPIPVRWNQPDTRNTEDSDLSFFRTIRKFNHEIGITPQDHLSAIERLLF